MVRILRNFCVGSAQPKDESEMERFMKLANSNNVEVLCFPEWFIQSKDSVNKLSKLTKEYGFWSS